MKFQQKGDGSHVRSEERLAKGRAAEVNNGRLAMLGLFSILAESKARGAVPVLGKYAFPTYDGDLVAPFSNDWTLTNIGLVRFLNNPSAGVIQKAVSNVVEQVADKAADVAEAAADVVEAAGGAVVP